MDFPKFKTTKSIEDLLKFLYPDLTPNEIEQQKEYVKVWIFVLCVVLFSYGFFMGIFHSSVISKLNSPHKIQVSELKIIAMDFKAELNNNSTTKQSHYLPLVSARWDLLIRVPGKLFGNYICLQGNLQTSFLYKNVTLVTSSLQSYNKFESGTPQLLNISAVATEDDLNGAIGKEIVEAIKEMNEIRFGSQVSLTDCREETKKGTINYECDEATLRLQPGSDHIKGTTFGNHLNCVIINL